MIKQPKASNQSGLGIGTIIIAVILISAIVAAISAATKSGGFSRFFGETDRIYASTVISTGSDISVALQRGFAIGYSVLGITLENPPEEGKLDIFDRKKGYLKRPQISASAVARGGIAKIDLAVQPVFDPSTPEKILVIYPLTDNVCRQINNIMNNTPVESDLIDVSNIQLEEFLEIPEKGRSIQNSFYDAGASFYGTVNGIEQEVFEGCAIFSNNINVYFRVL